MVDDSGILDVHTTLSGGRRPHDSFFFMYGGSTVSCDESSKVPCEREGPGPRPIGP